MLLDAVTDYLPSPVSFSAPPSAPKKSSGRKKPMQGKEGGQVFPLEGPLAALAFKVTTDSFVGTLTYVRVYSGKVTLGESGLESPPEKKGASSKISENACQ